jgi:hypothetical protein
MKYAIVFFMVSLVSCYDWKEQMYDDVQTWCKTADSTYERPFTYKEDAVEWMRFLRDKGYRNIVFKDNEEVGGLYSVELKRNK